MADGGPRGTAPSRAQLVLIAGMVLLLGTLVYVLDLAHLDADQVAAQIRGWGSAGPVGLIALLIAQAVIAPLPSPPLLMAAGYVYGPWEGFAIGGVGLLLGASACFALARIFGRRFAERFVSPQRLAAIDREIGSRPGSTVLAVVSLRVFMPPAFDAVSYGCGLVQVPFRWFALATALGEIPKVGSFSYLGAAAGGVSSWLTAWILLTPALGLIALRLLRSRWHPDAVPEAGEVRTRER